MSYIESHGSDDTFKDYFGTNDPQNVIDNFNYITTLGPNEPALYCNKDPYKQCGTDGYSAYTVRRDPAIYYCDRFFTQAHLDWLCESWGGEERYLGGTTLSMLAYQLIPDVHQQELACSPGERPDIFISINYEVSTWTLHELLGDSALTRDCDLRSALLSKHIRTPGASNDGFPEEGGISNVVQVCISKPS